MRRIVYLFFALLALAACQGGTGSQTGTVEDAKPVIQVAPENLVSLSFDVEGMDCTGCERTVEVSLKNIEGVLEADASHETGKTLVKYDKTLVTVEKLEAGISSGGYRVTGHSQGE